MNTKTQTPEGHQVVSLTYPIKTATGLIDKLTLRRAKVKDMKAAQRHGTPAEQELALLALITAEKITPEDIEELDLADYANLQRTFQNMVAGNSTNPASGGNAGEVVSLPAK